MLTTKYISTSVQKKVSLAEASWQVFRPFLSCYQWAFDHPSHSPRKVEIASAILNRKKKGSCTFPRPEGYRYKLPVLHDRNFKQAIEKRRKLYYVSYGQQALLYLDTDIHKAWQRIEDGREAQSLLDRMLTRFFGEPVLFSSASALGGNDYLKVNLCSMDYESVNAVFARVQTDLQLFLASCGNLADFEVKGTVGFLRDEEYHWGNYGKLPIYHPDWNFARLEEFRSRPAVSINALTALCERIEAQIPMEVLQRHKAYKESRGDDPFWQGDYFLVTPAIEQAIVEAHGQTWRYTYDCDEDFDGNLWIHRRYHRPGQLPLTGREWREIQKRQYEEAKRETECGQMEQHELGGLQAVAEGSQGANRPGTRPGMETVASENQQGHQWNDGQADGDECRNVTGEIVERRPGPRHAGSGVRDTANPEGVPRSAGGYPRPPVSRSLNLNLSDLIGEPDSFKRQKEALMRFARYLKRVPTDEEGLDLIEDHHLFSAPWDKGTVKRRTRVRDILKFIARTFDPGKCANGSVSVGKYEEWARKKFPNGLIGRNRSSLSEDGNRIDGQGIHVSPSFIAVFMAVCEFALLIDKNQDDSLPHHRAESIWETLYAKGLVSVPFCARKWAICREVMVSYGIVVITDRDYHTGKAMKWALGPYFPFLGLWKTIKQASLLGPGCFARRLRTTEQEHNTLLRKQSPMTRLETPSMPARPPP